MPPGALFPFSYCQERVIYGVIQLFSALLFLWFRSTLAESLTSSQCTHCNEKQCFQRVPRVPVINQSCAGLRCSARVTLQDVNKVVNKQCFPGNASTVSSSFLQYLRDYQGVLSCTEPGCQNRVKQSKKVKTRPIPPGRVFSGPNVALITRRTNASVSLTYCLITRVREAKD